MLTPSFSIVMKCIYFSYKGFSRLVKFLLPLAILILPVTPSASAQGKKAVNFVSAKKHFTVMGGYGVTHKGLGATETTVETIDVIFRYGRFLTKEAGKSWYRGRHEIYIEVPVRTVINPETAVITGINIMAAWSFTSSDKTIPYVFAGGGPVYTNLDIPGLGTELNYSYQGGLGIYYFIRKDMALNFNYRLQHISNADTADPNEPLNSSRILFGLSFFK